MDRLEQFFELLRKWNDAIRLTGSTDQAALERHVAEARVAAAFIPDGQRVCDVGAGNGFPGIALALLRPNLILTLVEPIAKKVAFLRECRRHLELENVSVIRARDDELTSREDFEPFDVAISQATFAPAEWLERGSRLTRSGGRVIAMLGENRVGLETLPFAIEVHEVEIPGTGARAVAVRFT